MIHKKITEIESILGLQFTDKELLTKAFVHGSYANEHRVQSYQNLEFLGDGILQSVITVHLYNYMGNDTRTHSEGVLTVLRSNIVKKEPLTAAAKRLGLDRYILQGKGIDINKIKDNKIVSDVMEAVIGAVYTEFGYSVTTDFVLKVLDPEIKEAFNSPLGNPKSNLQEYFQKRYRIIKTVIYNTEAEGNEFISEVSFNGKVIGKGRGNTKSEAEKAAAGEALKKLKKL